MLSFEIIYFSTIAVGKKYLPVLSDQINGGRVLVDRDGPFSSTHSNALSAYGVWAPTAFAVLLVARRPVVIHSWWVI